MHENLLGSEQLQVFLIKSEAPCFNRGLCDIRIVGLRELTCSGAIRRYVVLEATMIEINGVNKKFSNTNALNNVIAAVQEKSIFGLVGTNLARY